MNIIEEIRCWLFMRRLDKVMRATSQTNAYSDMATKRLCKVFARLERDEQIRGENHEFMVE